MLFFFLSDTFATPGLYRRPLHSSTWKQVKNCATLLRRATQSEEDHARESQSNFFTLTHCGWDSHEVVTLPVTPDSSFSQLANLRVCFEVGILKEICFWKDVWASDFVAVAGGWCGGVLVHGGRGVSGVANFAVCFSPWRVVLCGECVWAQLRPVPVGWGTFCVLCRTEDKQGNKTRT